MFKDYGVLFFTFFVDFLEVFMFDYEMRVLV